MPVTLKQLAAEAGVSIKTASNVVNERAGHYSPATCDRVMQAAARLGYTPNLAARHLRRGRTGMLALVLPDILNPYFSELATLVILAAEKLDYTVQVEITLGDPARERRILGGGHALAVDGLLLDSVSPADQVQRQAQRTPVVLLGEGIWGGPYDHVVIDNVAAARLATQHLIDLGRTRIAPVGAVGPHDGGMAGLRLAGYTDALHAAGLQPNPAYQSLPVAPTFDRAHGEAAMRALLALPQPPDALFCFSDIIALGALTALADAGLRVPADVAVIGIDDIAAGRYSRPTLSTIAPDKPALARAAVELLIDRIEARRSGPPTTLYAPFTLTPRASTAAPTSSDLPR